MSNIYPINQISEKTMDDYFQIQLPDFLDCEFQTNEKLEFRQFQNQLKNQKSIKEQKDNYKLKSKDSNVQKVISKKTLFVSSKQCDDQNQSNEQSDLENKQECLNRSQRNKIYSKLYRTRQKKKVKILEQENCYLKQKIDDLQFRLRQKQSELSRLKYQDIRHKNSFEIAKQKLMKQAQVLLQNNQYDNKELQTLTQQWKKLFAFEQNNQRMSLLNYYMSELLQNVIDDCAFYSIDCLVNEIGFWAKDEKTPMRRIDNEVNEILQLDSEQKRNLMRNTIPEFLLQAMKGFKTLWKKLYQDYLQIIQQGIMIENICKPIQKEWQQLFQTSSQLKLTLYFQKNKYRKDIRQLKQSWLQQQSERKQSKSHYLNTLKKIK